MRKLKGYSVCGIVLIILLATCISVQAGTYKRGELLAQVSGNTYYLDASRGNDDDNGSQATPWRTLSKAQSVAQSGDCIIINSGDYGAYHESDVAARNGYILYIANEDAVVHFDTINIANANSSDTYLIFHGINLKPDWVDPASSGNAGADDPQYPNSTLSTYRKTSNIVTLRNTNHLQIVDCKLEGQSKHLTVYGVTISGSNDISIDHCEITKTQRGVNFASSHDIDIQNNHIHDIGASAVVYGDASSTNVTIRHNHMHNSKYSTAEDYAPRASGQNYHGSGIALRNGQVTVKDNIIHDGFPSAGIMAYKADATGTPEFDNVTIENNLVYDIHTPYVLRIYDLGDNVVVRNNTLIGYLRTSGGGEYRYNTALTVHSLASNGNPSLTLSNNIFIGSAYFDNDYTTQNNNIFYSWSEGGKFQCSANSGSRVLACNYSADASADIAKLFSCGPNCDFSQGHGKNLDFTLAAGSPAINFGDAATQPADSLGSLKDGFLVENGPSRTSTKHSAGAYETGAPASTSISAPANLRVLKSANAVFNQQTSFEDDFDYSDTPGGYSWRDDWVRATWTMNSTQMSEAGAVPENNLMKITITPEFQGGCIETRKQDFSYGRWEARLKPSSVGNMVNAMFTNDWDDETTSDSTSDGTHQEVDIEFLPQTFGGGKGEVHLAVHSSEHVNHFVRDIELDFDPSQDFHVWGFEILPDKVVWFVDDRLLATYSYDSAVKIDAPYQFFFNGWTSTSNWVQGPPSSVGYFYIDWVKFYPMS